MKRRLTRRSLLAAAGSIACLAAAPRPARADAPSMDGLLAINDDDNAVLDALTDQMWNAPQLAFMTAMANTGNSGPHVDSMPQQRSYGVDFAAPGPAGLKIDDANFVSFNATLALLFVCIDAAAVRPEVNGFVDAAAAAARLKTEVRTTSAHGYSDLVYLKLLQLSRPKNHPGAPLFTAYSRDWGDRLAATLQSGAFIAQALHVKDQALARRNLSLQLYKLKQLGPNSVAVVQQRWRAGDLARTVFPLAAADAWPPNYYDMMVRTEQTPLKPLVNALLATHTTGSHQECVPTGMGEISCANVDDDYYGASFVAFLRGQTTWLEVQRR